MSSTFSRTHVGARNVVKTYRSASPWVAENLAQHEASYLLNYSWAAPTLLDFSGSTLVMERLETPPSDWRPVTELRSLLEGLGQVGVHHRDAHPGNVMQCPETGWPLLIDWEVAIHWISAGGLSYDLHGPEATGVPKPAQHRHRRGRYWRPGVWPLDKGDSNGAR